MQSDLKELAAARTPQALPDVRVPAGHRVLVLGPHPDDFDAIGVTLRYLHDRGNPLEAAVIRTGSGIEPRYRPNASREELTALRDEEQRNSLRFFGLPPENATFVTLENDDTDQPLDNNANRAALHELIMAKRPDIVCLPYGNDSNSGHRNIFAMFVHVADNTGRPLVAMFNRDPKTIEIRTDLYMPFGQQQAEWKAQLLRHHDSQHQRNLNTRGHGFDTRILETNRRIARELELDAPYAEAFQVAVRSGA